jgi:hypothetical protein
MEIALPLLRKAVEKSGVAGVQDAISVAGTDTGFESIASGSPSIDGSRRLILQLLQLLTS